MKSTSRFDALGLAAIFGSHFRVFGWKHFALLGAMSVACLNIANAVEGMFPISEIGTLDLNSLGLKISAEQIFSPRKICLVDGICRVNGCTGSFVSDQGLIITNHHCAYRAIQSLSKSDRDYLRDGFTSKSKSDELHAPGYTVKITESYRDVSAEVLEAIDGDMDYTQRTKAIERRRKELEKAAELKNKGMRAEVAEMFQGKTYVLFLYTYIKDVRLVFAPPSSVGNFGGDVDNWEWPRHTGDFSFMRAYVAPDGATADYAADNVPYRPKRFIQVAPEGVRENDPVFLLGYPGRTGRHKTAAFLEYEEKYRLPATVENYQWQFRVMEEAGQTDRAVALKHSARSKSLANVEKRCRGQLKGLRQKQLVAKRKSREHDLQQFITESSDRSDQYGSLLADIAKVYAEKGESFAFDFHMDQLRAAPRAMAIGYALYEAAVERQKEDLEREPAYMDRNFDQTQEQLLLTVRDLDCDTDQQIFAGMLHRLADVEAATRVDALQSVIPSDASIDQQVNKFYQKSRMTEAEFVRSCCSKSPDELLATGEPVFEFVHQLFPTYLALRAKQKARQGRLDQLYGKLLEIQREFQGSSFVPDANATLRMTCGRVERYSPEDAVIKTPITTLAGVVAKTTGVSPFITPQRILDMHAKREFASFAEPDLKDVPVAILYSTDTTGGNSGSPIFNASGQLVGVNFDRAFEATINDFAWDASYSRSIGVDVRYVLWITGIVYEAERLLKEMNVR